MKKLLLLSTLLLTGCGITNVYLFRLTPSGSEKIKSFSTLQIGKIDETYDLNRCKLELYRMKDVFPQEYYYCE